LLTATAPPSATSALKKVAGGAAVGSVKAAAVRITVFEGVSSRMADTLPVMGFFFALRAAHSV
jgi:hypothetical protein